MSTSNRSETAKLNGPGTRRRGSLPGMLIVLMGLIMLGMPLADAQVARAQRAIEELEKCSAKERKAGCVDILKVEDRDGDRQAIKAQVRGRRIIWYEYNRKSGKVRRTN